MEWNEREDILLCHEVLQPYRAKEKTVGRSQAWEKIANNLNKRADFKVNKRSVRDHYMVHVEKIHSTDGRTELMDSLNCSMGAVSGASLNGCWKWSRSG